MAVDNQGTTIDLHLGASTARNDPATVGEKRKSADNGTESDHSEAAGPQPSHNQAKKIKLAQDHTMQDAQSGVTAGSSSGLDKSLLPPEVWHHIFTFCPPRSLGNLLATSRLFNLYLDPVSPVRGTVPPTATSGALNSMEPNTLWQASRRLFWPQMPSPLRSKTELDMWRLACSPRCQECSRLYPRGQTSPPDPRHPGPGTEGVATIWAFGSRMCATCLLKKSDKELDLQISPSIPSAIIPALPFIFLTQDRDVFSPTTFEQSQLPADLQVTKLFSKPDVEALQGEFLQVKDMGQGTVGEWLKGLPGRGSDLQHEASKWEKWEASGGTMRMCSQLYPGHEKKSLLSLPQKPSANPSLPPLPTQRRHERTADEAAELKAARKAEIERRSLLLDPPLTADVLCLIPSFQAATHIVARLDDDAWERLRPRLLAQRTDAEKVLQGEPKAKSKVKQELREQRHLETTQATEKEARDRIDKEWEDVQAPLRAKIAGYADAAIQDGWGKGRKVTRENCSRFAVDSLLYVRKRFYTEVAKDVAAARAASKTPPMDPPEGPFTQKLTLENMKWIFDTKIKPRTDPLRKELFYCNGCEGNYKPFGFEGAIQHYAAKHTSALSLGSIVVHWRAEWPEHPPFSATGRSAKAPFRLHAQTGFAVNGGGTPLSASYSYPPAGTLPAPPPAYPPPTVGYGYTPSAYGDHYQQAPPLPHPYHAQSAPPPPFAPQPGYEQQLSYAIPPAPYPTYQPPAMTYPAPAAVEPAPSYVSHQGGQYDYRYGSYQAPNAGGPYAPPQPLIHPDLYQNKVDDIALNSREVWRVLGDIRDLPGDVRVFVTIHHLVKRFRSRFYETPPLSMFIDGLSNNKEMRPVRNVNGLVCKACQLGLGNAALVEQDRKDFSLPQLANHFQSQHIQPMQTPQATSVPLDWVVDMVLVSDLTVLPGLASSANEPQKALLSAALPDAFQSRQHEQTPTEQHPATEADVLGGYRTSNGPAGRPDATELAGANLVADHRILAQSPQNTTPRTFSENGRSVHSDGGRHSAQGVAPNRGQNGYQSHKRAAGEIERGNPQGDPGFGDRALGKRKRENKRTRDERRKREVADVRLMPATSHIETTSAHPSFARPERSGTTVGSHARAPTLPNAQPLEQPEKSYPAPPANVEREPGVMAALESYLEPGQLPHFQGQRSEQDPALYTNTRDPVSSSAFRSGPGTYTRYSDREGRAQSPPPASRGRSPDGRQFDPVYYPRPPTIGTRSDAHGHQRTQAGLIEPLPPRHAEDGRFGLPALRLEDRGHNTTPPEADYRRYHEERRMPSRPPVETYEIVHVIDEHGEYYIRRPARREPDPRFIYEERRAHHDVGPHQTLDSVYGHISRPGLIRDGVRASVAPEGRPGDRRADPAYYEEYDPRFPAA
ncbi:hypothetical protein C8A00DRAFT_14811 [Chaetomidium leptoderma]|uniref:DUF7892 domain-containing protein n=1 Tax=Chaetomidium leptoderma TaxID=669021 RepID=A0AAN6VLZ2_9PEZI|nr:hypothetical protein C8A00DRAFT_14811 [Chaetomidium leptoderma]